MNDKITAHTVNVVTCLANKYGAQAADVAELVSTAMEFAYAEGKLEGIQEMRAVIECERAMFKARVAQ